MATITDVSAWLAGVDTEDHEEIYAMYTCTRDIGEVGSFSCSTREKQNSNLYFVKYLYSADILMLASDNARAAFLKLVERKYAGPEWNMETWYDFKCEMAKED